MHHDGNKAKKISAYIFLRAIGLTDSEIFKQLEHPEYFTKTFKEYDWIFRVRDQYQSWATKDELKPQRFIRNAQEGNSKVYFDYSFNQAEDEIYLKKSRNVIKRKCKMEFYKGTVKETQKKEM